MTVLEYYSDKSRHVSELKAADIVLTTYGILTSESTNKGPIYQISWFRVVIDEAHTIRNRNTATAKAVFKIQSEHKWVLTGTPIQNTIDDLYSLIRFLEVEPWSDYIWWNKIITQKFMKKDSDCFVLLQRLLKPIMLRRTKHSKLENGRPIISLPDLRVHNIKIEFSTFEQNLYSELVSVFKVRYNELLRQGNINIHVSCIFDLLLRLRQFCDHPYLTMSRGDVTSLENLVSFMNKYTNSSNANYIEELKEKIKQGVDFDCPICFEPCEDPVLTKCAHVLCRHCAIKQLEKIGNCPYCKTVLSSTDLTTCPRNTNFSIDLSKE